jgi:periplasmic copper chaperone A
MTGHGRDVQGEDQVHIATVRRAGVFAAATAIAVLGLAGTAFAHVSVSPSSAQQGSESVITFRVPSESDTASTTKVDLYLPTDHPIAVVDVQQIAGWTVQVKETTLKTPIKDDDGNEVTSAVSEVIWNADSPKSAIQPGQFQQFPVELGPLPETDSIAFKVLQTYSDGTVVSWIDVPVPGQDEPEHPTPVLTLTPASASSSGAPVATSTAAASPTSSSSSNTWGIVGAILGLIGAILGGAAYARTRDVNQPKA